MLEYLIINLNSTEFTIQQGSHNIRQFVDTCIPIIHLKIGPKYILFQRKWIDGSTLNNLREIIFSQLDGEISSL